jgi:hypothetical protein
MISRYNISGYWGLQTPQGASTNAARRFNKRRKALQQTPQGASTNAARRFNKRRKALQQTPQGASKRNQHNHRPDQLYQQPN